MLLRRIFPTMFLILFCHAFSVPTIHAAAWAVLHDGDLHKFTTTFPGMYREYQKLGLRINPQTGKIEGMHKARRNNELNKILDKNGWDGWFWLKLQTIVRGYSLTKYNLATTKHGANIDKFVQNLKNSRWMTPEKKAELDSFYTQTRTKFSREAEKLRRQVHPKDLTRIVTAMDNLDAVMQEVIQIQWQHQSKNRAIQ